MHQTLLDKMNKLRDPFRGYYWERRPWSDSRKLKWTGPYRAKPHDGYSSPALLYGTGKPAQDLSE